MSNRESGVVDRGVLSEVDCAWIAAVIDCEGTVTIHRPVVNKATGSRGLQHYCRVEMVGHEITERLYELCGGTYVESKQKPGNRNPQSYWHITPRVMRWLFPQILPHMLIKRRQVEIMIDILAKRYRGSGESNITDKELLTLYQEVRSLNKKGKIPKEW